MIIDMDTHILPRDIYDYMEGPTADQRPQFEYDKDGLLVKWSFPGNFQVKGTTPLPPPGAGGKHLGLSNMDVRLEEFRKLGIDKQILLSQFSAIYFNYTLEPELAFQMAHSHNIAIMNLLKKYPNELIGAALVALQDVPTAIAEMEWAKKNGFQAIAMDKVFPVREHQFSETLGSHRELWPFFKRAEELGMPIVFAQRAARPPHQQHDDLPARRPRHAVPGRRPDEPCLAMHERALRRFPEPENGVYRSGQRFHQAVAGKVGRRVRETAAQLRRRRCNCPLSPPRCARQRAAFSRASV